MHKVFPPHGSCIYCGATGNLGKEHIVPFGLCADNQFILPKASCPVHSGITSKFEQDVLRGPMWPVRAHLQLKSRHAALAPRSAPLTFSRADGSTFEEHVPLTEHPLPLLFPLLLPPSELSGLHKSGVSIRGDVTVSFGNPPDAARVQRLGAVGVRISQSYRLVPFSQMLAKIAWAFAAGEGLLRYVDPSACLLPALVETPNEVGRWVGSVDEVPTIGPQPSSPNVFHEVLAFERCGYLLYRIQLFTPYRTPYYWVVVGMLRQDHPKIADPITASTLANATDIIGELRALQPGAVPVSGPNRMTSVSVSRQREPPRASREA